jgi:hypothetical protein
MFSKLDGIILTNIFYFNIISQIWMMRIFDHPKLKKLVITNDFILNEPFYFELNNL